MATSLEPHTRRSATDLTATEAAHRLKLGYYAVRDAILRHELQGYKQGNRWFVTTDSLEQYAARREER